MKRDEYRNLFSDYREGTLEPGLATALESYFVAEPDMRAEYDAFHQDWSDLAIMAKEPIEVPTYLSARIFDRLEAEASPRRYGLPSWFGWRTLGLGALGAAAVLGAFVTMMKPSEGVATAGVLPGQSAPSLRVVPTPKGATLSLNDPQPREIAIFSEPEVILLQRYQIDGNVLRTELENPNAGAATFRVVATDLPTLLIAIPGHEPAPAFPATGDGSLLGFARGLARAYRAVVVLEGSPGETTTKWTLSGKGAFADASATLAAQGYRITAPRPGLIMIRGK